MMRIFVVPAVLLAVMPAAASSAAPSAAPSGRALMGVTCPRVTSCWAVGAQLTSGASRTLIEHWNGSKWSLKPSPSVAGASNTFLRGVSCSAGANCWAVGAAFFRSAKSEPIAEHWNGSKWSLTVLPEPAHLTADSVVGVWCPATTRCWAVGLAAHQVGGASRPLAEHWTGKRWSVVPASSSGSTSNLFGVFCRRDTDCWAVGGGPINALAEHWNGRHWSIVATPSAAGGMTSVWCPGTDCFGTGTGGFPSAVAERWNGTKWSRTATAPLPMGTISGLPGVSCATSVNCFAVGFANSQTLIEQWRGSKWVKVKSPNPAGAAQVPLSGVVCLSSRQCWAVGESIKQDGTNHSLVERWNGKRWSIVPTP